MRLTGSILLFLSTISLIGLITFSSIRSIQFEQNCKGYLKHAADANTISIAEKELSTALEFIEMQKLDTGSTHAFYPTPACDLDFWYQNLQAAQHELATFPKNADPLTRSNQLMKLRETLVDQGKKGPRVTLPPNITYYPHQTSFRVMTLLSLMACALGFVTFASSYEHSCDNSVK